MMNVNRSHQKISLSPGTSALWVTVKAHLCCFSQEQPPYWLFNKEMVEGMNSVPVPQVDGYSARHYAQGSPGELGLCPFRRSLRVCITNKPPSDAQAAFGRVRFE